jgi:hypothetical protein
MYVYACCPPIIELVTPLDTIGLVYLRIYMHVETESDVLLIKPRLDCAESTDCFDMSWRYLVNVLILG